MKEIIFLRFYYCCEFASSYFGSEVPVCGWLFFFGDDCCAFTGLISLPQFLRCTAVFLFRVRFLFPLPWSQDPVLGVRSALGNNGWRRSICIFTARHTPSAPTTCFSLSRTEYRPYSALSGLIHRRPQQPFLDSVFPGIAGRAVAEGPFSLNWVPA
jgi:hypothetical protein